MVSTVSYYMMFWVKQSVDFACLHELTLVALVFFPRFKNVRVTDTKLYINVTGL